MPKRHTLEAVQVEEAAGNRPSCQLLLDGQAVTPPLAGVVLEGSFDVPGGQLVFLTEGNPFEEALHLHLLGKDWQPKDHLEISAPYTAGLLSKLDQPKPGRVSFRFPEPMHWIVEVQETPMSWFRGPWNRAFRSLGSLLGKRYLALRSVAQGREPEGHTLVRR